MQAGRCSLAVIIICCASSLAATVDPPLRINVAKLDRSPLSGMITSFDENEFELMNAQKQTSKVGWEELPPDVVMNLHERLVRKGSGDQWLDLGRKLLTMPGGRAPAERAFQKAVKLDANLKDKINELRKQANLAPPPAARPTPQPGATTQPTAVVEPTDPSKPIVGPQQVGEVDPTKWGKQTPQETAASIEELKQFAEEAKQKIPNPQLVLYETQFFLFYSDLATPEAQKWMGLLDRMYGRLAELFAVPKGENIWRGKALVFVFAKDSDYYQFEIKMHKSMAAGTAGMCHTYGSGEVHIAFYRQANEQDFAHVLVHESTHGFLHRYRSAQPIPSWANEGLAEVIAGELVRRPGIAQSAAADARQDLQTRKSFGKMFDENHIVAWQYPVARTLCEFMIRQSKQGYVDFINGIKDGMGWEESLKQKYGVTLDQLVRAYGNSIGVAGLKVD